MNRLQQRYKLIISKIDVTSHVVNEVSLTYNPDTISELNFTLDTRSSEGLVNMIYPSSKVVFYGGAHLENSDNYGKLFEGIVKKVNPVYSTNGSINLSIHAMDLSYEMVSSRGYFVYPDHSRKSSKTWAHGNTIKTSQLVRNLVQEAGFTFGTTDDGHEDLRILVDKDITYLKPITQRNESMWQILRKIASTVNCQVWTTFSGSTYQVHFVDRSFLINSPERKDFTFVYPERNEDGGFVSPELKKNNVPIWDVDIEQDYSQMFHVNKVMTAFDYSRGEEINVIGIKFDENGKEVTKFFTFELNQELLKTLNKDELNYAQSLGLNRGSYDYTDDQLREMSKYFVPAKFYTEKNYRSVDAPYYGLTLKFICEGNVSIVPKRNYRVEGLGKYGSKNLSGSYYLRKLTHIWGSKGFLSKLELVR